MGPWTQAVGLFIIINLSCTYGDYSSIISSLYKKANQNQRPLILVLDKSNRNSKSNNRFDNDYRVNENNNNGNNWDNNNRYRDSNNNYNRRPRDYRESRNDNRLNNYNRLTYDNQRPSASNDYRNSRNQDNSYRYSRDSNRNYNSRTSNNFVQYLQGFLRSGKRPYGRENSQPNGYQSQVNNQKYERVNSHDHDNNFQSSPVSSGHFHYGSHEDLTSGRHEYYPRDVVHFHDSHESRHHEPPVIYVQHDRNDEHDYHRDVAHYHAQREPSHYHSEPHLHYRQGRIYEREVRPYQQKDVTRSKKKYLRSSIVKSLLRAANDINCQAQEECKDDCAVEEKKTNDCEDQCKEQNECQTAEKLDTCEKDECSDSKENDNPSTRGIVEGETQDNCYNCKFD